MFSSGNSHQKYEKLSQNDEDFEIKALNKRKIKQQSSINLSLNDQEEGEESDSNSENSSLDSFNLNHFLRPKRSKQNARLICIFNFLILSAFLFFIVFIFIGGQRFNNTVLKLKKYLGKFEQTSHKNISQNISQGEWSFKIEAYGTESCIRLFDINEDGLDDLIFGLAGVEEINLVNKSNNSLYTGLLMGLRGYDGEILWKTETKSEIFELNCHLIDINRVNLLFLQNICFLYKIKAHFFNQGR